MAMRFATLSCIPFAFVATMAADDVAAGQSPRAGQPAGSPWNGEWVISPTRNSPATIEDAAQGYRFDLRSDGRLRWEIPSLGEVVEGRTDDRPMPIHRPGLAAASLSVAAAGPYVLTYRVFHAGTPVGEGRMTLVEGGKAWVDISGPAGRPDLAGVAIYVRPSAARR